MSNEQEPAVLDLDTMERPGGQPVPFRFKHDDKNYLLADPQEVDWQQLISAMSNPHRFLQLVLPADQHDDFFGGTMPSWKMNAMMAAYQKHYGLPDVDDALRQTH